MNLRTPVVAAAGIIVAASVASAPAASAAPIASAAKPLSCHASMSNSRPRDYTSTEVLVNTARHARVTTVAHYRTVNTIHHGTANSKGRTGIWYYISGATPGYQVKVRVSVVEGGRKGSCSTSFIPHR